MESNTALPFHVADDEAEAQRGGRTTRPITISSMTGLRRQDLDRYLNVAEVGLRHAFDAQRREFPQTARAHAAGQLSLEGASVRYTAIAGLGLLKLDVTDQKLVLAGGAATDLVVPVLQRSLDGTDPGAVALAVWFAAEAGSESPLLATAVAAVERYVADAGPIPTVDQAWMLTALLTVGLDDRNLPVARELVTRLLRHQADLGIFPHVLPPESQSRLRSHVGCFADQVYPIQALARYSAVTGDPNAMAAANRCAQRICALQGQDGQWWWHYDARTSGVVEGFPVYSVHQHAMAPMVLMDLYEAGGDDLRDHVVKGLDWIDRHPEMSGRSLVDDELGVIWRKIGRDEPRKAVRKLRSVTTAFAPALPIPFLDRLFPPTVMDNECRPYELGWMLYAWPRTETPTLEQPR